MGRRKKGEEGVADATPLSPKRRGPRGKLHWTQRPENHKRVKAILKKAQKARVPKLQKRVIEAAERMRLDLVRKGAAVRRAELMAELALLDREFPEPPRRGRT
jgi:hypothetical protein